MFLFFLLQRLLEVQPTNYGENVAEATNYAIKNDNTKITDTQLTCQLAVRTSQIPEQYKHRNMIIV